MTQVIRGSRRIVIAAVAAALLGGTALLAVSPSPASAERHPCGNGEFCLYFNEDNDHYEGGDSGARCPGTGGTTSSPTAG